MFIQVPKNKNLIRLPRNFFSLDNIRDNGDLEVEVTYHINQSDVVRKNTSTCRISVVTRLAKKINVVQDQTTQDVDTGQVVKNILSLMPTARNAIKNSENYVVAAKNADNTSQVNNENITRLRRGVPLGSISSMIRPTLALKSVRELNTQNNVHPIMQINPPPLEPIDNKTPIRHVLQTSLIRNGLDPSYVNELNDNLLTPLEAFQGVYKKVSQNHVNNSSSPSNFVSFFRQITTPFEPIETTSTIDASEDKNILVVTYDVVDKVDIVTDLVLPNEKIRDKNGDYNQVFIKFELLDTSGVAVEVIQQKVDILKHIEIFHTPKHPPVVNFAKFETQNKGNIQVKQQDLNAKTVQIFRKNFSYCVNDIDSYTFINEFPVQVSSGFVTIPVDVSSQNTTIYRVIPVGENRVIGAEFSNVVINPSKPNKKLTYCSLTCKVVDVGVNVEAREVPADVVALRFLRRDATIFETDFSVVGDDVIQVDPNNVGGIYTVTDVDVKSHHNYEYSVKMIYRDGNDVVSGSEIIEYLPLVVNLVSAKIENLQVIYDINNLNVTFTLNSSINDTTIDVIKNLLQKQGLEEFFVNDITKEREKLQQLIAHQVHRVDLTTGQRENFGEVTTESFSDVGLQPTNAVQPIKTGHKYRYEVVTLLRATETMLENFVKMTEDAETKKPIVFQPSKFLHPITLLTGNIVTPQTLLAHYPKGQMSFGNVGNLVSVDVSFSADSIVIIEASAENFDKHNELIKWRINGNPGAIDHFVIMKEFLGQRKIIGKSHASFEKTTFQYVYPHTNEDLGELVFAILPVFNTYEIGAEIRTNGIQIQ